MSGINFKGVEEAKDKTMTRAGTIDIFDITDVEFSTTKNKGTYYMGVSFSRKADAFKHSFFLSEKALPRVKSLVKAASGVVLEDNVMEEQLTKLLKGRQIALKVTGKIDETNGRAYPDLAFGGFCKPVAELSELAFGDKEDALNKKCQEVYDNYDPSAADKPAAPTAAPAPGASMDTEEDMFASN